MVKKARRKDIFEALTAAHERAIKLKEEIERLREEALMELGKELLKARLEGQEMILPEELEARLEVVKKAFSGQLKKQKKTSKTEPENSRINQGGMHPEEGMS